VPGRRPLLGGGARREGHAEGVHRCARALLASIGAVTGTRAKGHDRKAALFAASAAVGALVLARATHDESIAGELLSVVRERLLEAPTHRR